MVNFKSLFFLGYLLGLVSCQLLTPSLEERDFSYAPEKNSLHDYLYLEDETEVYNSFKIAEIKKKEKERLLAIQKLNSMTDLALKPTSEEEIEKKAYSFIYEKKWEQAFDVLLTYEPILTHNKNLTHLIVLTSFKLAKYEFAIQQLNFALSVQDDSLQFEQLRADRLKLLETAEYLTGRTEKNDDSQGAQTISLNYIDEFADKYIYSKYSQDAVFAREEYKTVTRPIRLPASLELKKSK